APIVLVDVGNAEANHEQDDRYFDDDDERVKLRALFNSDGQDRRDQQRDQEGRQVEADLDTKNMWRPQQIVGLLDQFGRVCRGNRRDFLQDRLRARYQGGVGSLRHLAGNGAFRGAERRPVVVGQPQRYFQVKDIEKLDEVVRPAGRYRTRSHG